MQTNLIVYPIEALKNPRTNKLFIILEFGPHPDKVKVINPNGDVLDVATVIFDMDSPISIDEKDAPSSFSPEQLKTFGEYQERSQKERLASQSNKSRRFSLDSTTPSAKAPRKASSNASRKGAPKGPSKTIEWSCDVLTFYRHKIEPLKDNDFMAISVLNQGVFKLSKVQFNRTFNQVVMSPEYRQNGVFSFKSMPEHAQQFKTSSY